MESQKHAPSCFIDPFEHSCLALQVLSCPVTVFFADVLQDLNNPQICWYHWNLVASEFLSVESPDGSPLEILSLQRKNFRLVRFTLIWKQFTIIN